MPIEFVDREKAEAGAARAIGLLNQSDEAKVEAWFAMQAVADQVGPASNVGVRGVWWQDANKHHKGHYKLYAECTNGRLQASAGRVDTLEEARDPERLARVVELLNTKVAEMGGFRELTRRRHGTSDALLRAVCASETGRAWAESIINPAEVLLRMVNVADAYGREGVNPRASLSAHRQFMAFPNRAELIREYPEQLRAKAKAMSLRNGEESPLPKYAAPVVAESQVVRLALRSGVTRKEARIILRAMLDGRSKTKIMRAVNEAARMVEQMQTKPSPAREKVAA